jgi:hypothetical protein
MMISTKKCLICKGGAKNDCLHWHKDPESGDIWVWCQGICQRGYSLRSYCYEAGISLPEFLKGDFNFIEARPNEVNEAEFPTWFVPMSDPRAAKGVEYVKSRGLTLDGDMYYDTVDEGIVFPYYLGGTFCGAQVRFIKPRINKDGDEWKITTMSGTRLGLLFYGWNQDKFVTDVKGVIITEGAFNALAIQQSLNLKYGGISKNPWRVIACSGSGSTKHQTEMIKELKDQGVKIIVAPDSDEAGLKMLKKFSKAKAVSHYAFTGDSDHDWNDVIKEMGHEEFAKYFFTRVKKV